MSLAGPCPCCAGQADVVGVDNGPPCLTLLFECSGCGAVYVTSDRYEPDRPREESP